MLNLKKKSNHVLSGKKYDIKKSRDWQDFSPTAPYFRFEETATIPYQTILT